jgi:phenylalanyl-tRNA synthetase beta chain
VKIVRAWLSELAPQIPDDVETVAREISLRGFEIAGVEHGVIDFDITANRPDCLNHQGIAREAAVIWGAEAVRERPLHVPHRPDGAEGDTRHEAVPERPVQVTIEDADLCPRYAAQVFDVTVGPSPAWLSDRLEAAGVRSINNVVDVTNYVMLEMGQPMHAFDLDRLAGGRLIIRRARVGERLTTLDGVDRPLDPEMLVIADAQRPVAVGGVMGGQDSEIGAGTKRMVLESASFHPASVRRTSKRMNLKTEASTRFERGGDIGAPPSGLMRAAELFERLGAAEVRSPIVDVYPTPRQPLVIGLRAARIERVLGMAVPPEEVPRILTPLGFQVRRRDAEGWDVTVPSFRVDVLREVDLVEEVGRHYGYDRLPATFPVLDAAQPAPDPRTERDRKIRAVLTAAGLSESMTFAFIERHAAAPFCPAGVEPIAIANPLSETFAVLRPSLLPGLVDSCAHNRRRGRKDVRLFETGSRFTAAGEGRAVGLAWSGAGNPAHWSLQPRGVDFFDIKGVVEVLCHALEISDPEFTPASSPFLAPGRGATVNSGGVALGLLGLLRLAIAEAHGFPTGEEVYVAELDVDALASRVGGAELRAMPLPKFPSIVRDLSILVGDALPAAAVRGTIRSAAPSVLQSIVEFDRYLGKGIPEGRVSLSLRLTFRSAERTLTDDEVDAAMAAIVAALERQHGAQRR